MLRAPPRSTLDRWSAASDVYKRQAVDLGIVRDDEVALESVLRKAADWCHAIVTSGGVSMGDYDIVKAVLSRLAGMPWMQIAIKPVSYTHLRAHETVLDLVCPPLLEKKKPHPPPPPTHFTHVSIPFLLNHTTHKSNYTTNTLFIPSYIRPITTSSY